ncbi:MAG: dethiobiotin synthase [Candidatus Hydrogenedens sp.]|nr:dethiobiotin synthase [Candidatus Hydrogenedens sp.]
MRGAVFITGTGTDVGKTIATGTLLRALRARGINAATMKPVQTGTDGSGAPDLAVHWAAAGWTPPEEHHADMAPYLFEHACSPHLAARETGRYIAFEDVRDAAQRLLESYEVLLIEGAGGLLVPFDDRRTTRDLITYLDCPALVVATTGLGTINHTLLTLESLQQAAIPVCGVLYCQTLPPADTAIEADNPDMIGRMSGIPALGVLPYQAPPDWAAWAERITGLESILKHLGVS